MKRANRVLSVVGLLLGKVIDAIRSGQEKPKLKARTGEIDPIALLHAMRKKKE